MTTIQLFYLEHMKLYRSFREEVPEESYTVPLGKAAVTREGTDVSIITYGAMVRESVKAAENLEKEGISVEVIDLRTVSPLDLDTIFSICSKNWTCCSLYKKLNVKPVSAQW